jgi:hypothetical protein
MQLLQFIFDVQNFATPLLGLRCYVKLRVLGESIRHTLLGYQLIYFNVQLNRLTDIWEATTKH